MTALYNEIDPFAAEWLRNLIDAGELPAGRVDERSIVELTGADLEGIDELHLFAGIGGWPLALRLAGWAGPVWTGSCPCQPFSSAGKRRGTDDERHLWPEMFRLVRECRPPTIFGEQVAGKAALGWLDGVFADLEGEGYACGAVIAGAHSVGAPHIRQRLFWMADAGQQPSRNTATGSRVGTGDEPSSRRSEAVGESGRCCGSRGLGDSGSDDMGRDGGSSPRTEAEGDCEREVDGAGCVVPRPAGATHWIDSITIPCRDGKRRRISSQSGDEPLAARLPRQLGPAFAGLGTVGVRTARRNRVGRLKGYGNAIIPQLAAEFVRAYMEAS